MLFCDVCHTGVLRRNNRAHHQTILALDCSLGTLVYGHQTWNISGWYPLIRGVKYETQGVVKSCGVTNMRLYLINHTRQRQSYSIEVSALLIGDISNDLERRLILTWHRASRGISAIAELLVFIVFCVYEIKLMIICNILFIITRGSPLHLHINTIQNHIIVIEK